MQLSTLIKNPGKKVPLFTAFIAAGILSVNGGQARAQNGLDFSLRGLVQTSALINSSDQGAGAEIDYKLGVSAGGGISIGYTFSKHLGAEIGFLYSTQKQGYKGDSSELSHNTSDVLLLSQEFARLAAGNNISFGKYTASIDMTTIKVPILLRFTGDNTRKSFFSGAIGPQINMLEDVKATINGKDAAYKNIGIKKEDLYKKTTVDAVLAMGVTFKLTEYLLLSGQLRLDYGLGNIENTDLEDPNGKYKFYDHSRKSTNNATGGALISVTYKLLKKAKKDDKEKTKSVEKTKKK